MTERSRRTLKKYFNQGCLPTAEQFHDLIDSGLNMQDEGFNKTPEDGVQVFTRGGRSSLLSFFREGTDVRTPPWRVRFDPGRDGLQFVHLQPRDGASGADTTDSGVDGEEAKARPVLSLQAEGRVGVNQDRPEHDLDVGGLIRSKGRVGIMPEREGSESAEQPLPVEANGEWHDITGVLRGCHAFEVLAGVGGKPRDGEYALLYATALSAFNPGGWFFNPFGFNFLNRKNRIRVQQAYFRSRRDKLDLRWHGSEKSFRLQIRSRRHYGVDENGQPVRILYHVTELWHHPFMRLGIDESGGERLGRNQVEQSALVQSKNRPASVGQTDASAGALPSGDA